MKKSTQALLGAILLSFAAAAPAAAQDPKTASSPAAAKAPDAIDLYFNTDSSAVRPEDEALLDRASRLYDEGKPIVMLVAGSTDRTGSPELNLKLSQSRANQVVQQLVARGIPVERLQVLAKGVSDPAIPDATDKSEPRDRRVEITWR